MSELKININNIANKVRTTVLTGLNTALTGVIVATDTVLEAFGKLQNQINGKVSKAGDSMTGDLTMTDASINTADSIGFDTLTPAATLSVGEVRWNDSTGTTEKLLKGGNVYLQDGQQTIARIVNKTNTNVLKSNYQVVKVTSAQGQRLAVNFAQANNDPNSTDTLGVIAENINNNQEGFIMILGQLTDINTTGSLQGETWADGDVLYLSPTVAGRITNIKPTAPNHMVVIGYVEYAHQNNGKIFVKIQNGYELNELHDVYAPSPTNGQTIKWNSTNLRYENGTYQDVLVSGNNIKTINTNSLLGSGDISVGTVTSVAALTLGTTGTDLSSTVANGTTTPIITLNVPTASATNRGVLSSTDWSTFNNKQNALGFTPVPDSRTLTINGTTFDLTANRSWNISTGITVGTTPLTSGTVGRILFEGAGNVLQEDAALFWDNTNKRLGVGATPSTSVRLDVRAQGALSTDIAFRVRNSADSNNLFELQGTGFINVLNTINSNMPGGAGVLRNIIQDNGNNLIFTFNRAVDKCISFGYNNTLSNSSNDYMANFGSDLSTSGAKSTNIGYNNTITSSNNFVFGRNFNVTTGTNNILIGTRATSFRTIVGSNFIFLGNGGDPNNIDCSSALFTYFNNAENPNHILRRRGNIALVGEKYQIINDGTGALGVGNRMDINAENTLTIHNGTSPSINITDAFQQYSADIVAGNAAPHFRTENGDIVKLYRVGGWGLPTGTFTRTTFNTATVTTAELAERVAALIQDLRDNHGLLKA